MSGMFNFADIFQFVVNCFNNRAFVEKYFIPHSHQTVFHIVFNAGNQMQSILERQFAQGSRNIPFVVDHQMEFEAIEPPHRAFSYGGYIFENTVSLDTPVFTNSHFSGINKSDTRAFAEANQFQKQGK
jgi:hypothetical protein